MERIEGPRSAKVFLAYFGATVLVIGTILAPGLLIPAYWVWTSTLFVIFVLLGTLRYYVSIIYSFRRVPEYRSDAKPSVDIVIPVLDEARVLPRNLRSLQNQDYTGKMRFIYVVDSRSSDASTRILERASASDGRIRVVVHEGRAGKVPALQTGYRTAGSDLIAFVDADVSLSRNFISMASRVLSSGPDAVKGRSTPRNKGVNLMTATISAERDIRERIEYYSKCSLGGFTVLTGGNFVIKRRVLDDLDGFDEDLMTEDMDLAARMQIKGYDLVHYPLMWAYEEAPGNIGGWYDQRYRWFRGWLQGSRRNLRSAVRAKGMERVRRTDAVFLMSFTLFAPLLMVYYFLLVLRTAGLFGGAMVPYEVTMITTSISIFTPLAIIMVGLLDRREGRNFPWVEAPAVLTIVPYLLVYSLSAWHAFLDEFILRRSNRYRKYGRSGKAC